MLGKLLIFPAVGRAMSDDEFFHDTVWTVNCSYEACYLLHAISVKDQCFDPICR